MRLLRRWLTVAVMTALVLVPAGHAQAQPGLDEVEDRIDEAWRELEPLIEEYNRVRSELKANKAESAQLAEEIAPLELKVDVAQAQLERIVAQQYKSGPMSGFGALLDSGSPTTFVEQLTVLDRLARDQRAQIAAARAAREDYAERKAEIDALIEKQQQQEAELEDRTEQIEAELARLEELREQAQARQQTSTSDALQSGACPAVDSSGPGAVAAEFACAQRGKPYQWGANGPGAYDCSGLTQQAWAEAGVSLTHYTGSQWNEGAAVSRADAVPGDLVFFYSDLSHVGLYIGAGLMVHASRAGEPVQIREIDSMPIAGLRRPG